MRKAAALMIVAFASASAHAQTDLADAAVSLTGMTAAAKAIPQLPAPTASAAAPPSEAFLVFADQQWDPSQFLGALPPEEKQEADLARLDVKVKTDCERAGEGYRLVSTPIMHFVDDRISDDDDTYGVAALNVCEPPGANEEDFVPLIDAKKDFFMDYTDLADEAATIDLSKGCAGKGSALRPAAPSGPVYWFFDADRRSLTAVTLCRMAPPKS